MDKLAEDILDNIYDGAYVTGKSGAIELWNRSAEMITGFSRSEVIRSRCCESILVHIDEKGQSLCEKMCPLKKVQDGEIYETSAYIRHKLGHRIPVDLKAFPVKNSLGEIEQVIEIFKVKESEQYGTIQRLREQAVRDPLTGLFNRRFLEESISVNLSSVKRYGSMVGIVFIDLDGFKLINDSMGHRAGDQLLKAVSMTILKNTRSSDIAGRWGGDEFLIIIPGLENEDLKKAADKLKNLISHTSILYGDKRVRVTASIGCVLLTDSDTKTALFDRVDELMYRNKLKGRSRSLKEGRE